MLNTKSKKNRAKVLDDIRREHGSVLQAARNFGCSPQAIYAVLTGKSSSQRLIQLIEDCTEKRSAA